MTGAGSRVAAGGGGSANAVPGDSGPLAPPIGTTTGIGNPDTYVNGNADPLYLDDTLVDDGRNGQPASGSRFARLIQYANQLAYQGKPLYNFIGAMPDAVSGQQLYSDASGTPLLRQVYDGNNYGAVSESMAVHYALSTGIFGLRMNDTSYSVTHAAWAGVGGGQYDSWPTKAAAQVVPATRGYVAANSELAVSSGDILASGVVWQEPQELIDATRVGSFVDSSGTQAGKNAYISAAGVYQGAPIVGVRSANVDSAEALQKLRVSLLNTYQHRRGQIGWSGMAVDASTNFIDFASSSQQYRYIFRQTFGGAGIAFSADGPGLTLPLQYQGAGLSTQVRCYVFVYARMTGATNTGSIAVANRNASGVMSTTATALTNGATVSGATWKWYPDKLSATTTKLNLATAPYFLGYAGGAYDRVALCAKSSGATDKIQIAAFSIVPVGDGLFA